MGSFRGWAEVVHHRAGLIDAGAALVLSAGGLITLARPTQHALLPLAVICSLIATSSVAWRSRAPLPAVGVAAASMVGGQWLTRAHSFPGAAGLALVLVLYSAGARGVSRRHLVELLGLAGLTVGVIVAIVAASGHTTGSSVATDVLPPLVALAAGYLVARQRNLAHQLAGAIQQLEAEEELRVAAVAARERNRVARELHDVVAHGVSAMVVQAGAARITAGAEPDLARAALAEVVTAGRSAIDELGRIVGPLRASGGDGGAPPRYGVLGIRTLVEGRRAAGLPVQLAITGDDSVLPDLIDATCYRLVQEALTNVVKHAPGAPTTVEVVVVAAGVDVAVRNAPPAWTGSLPSPGSGHGLVGMTERVAACGGHLSHGPQSDGGFEVRARLPLPGGGIGTGPARRPSALLERIKSAGTWPAVILALVVLCSDAAISSSRRGPLALNLGLTAGMAVILMRRRRFPLLFLIAVNALAFPLSNGLTSINKATLVSTFVFAVPVWTVAAWSGLGVAVAGLLAAIGFEVAEGVHWHLAAGSVAGNAVVSVALWLVGRVLRAQRRVSADLAETRARIQANQEVREQLTLAAARSRMVEELDRLVAAQIATMVSDAESAGAGLETDAAAESIARIEDDGRLALARLREILGLLRAEHDPGRLPSLLGVDVLDQLVTRFGSDFRVTGTPAPLTGGIDLLAYRIVERVLTRATCDAVELHFEDGGHLRLHFVLTEAASGWPDDGDRVDVERLGGRIDSTDQSITVQLPLVAPALA